MGHDRDSDADAPERDVESPLTDGGDLAGIDEARLHAIVRDAVEDAIYGAIGTLLLLGITLLFIASGFGAVLRASSPAGLGAGLAILAVGVGTAAVALNDVLPYREWL